MKKKSAFHQFLDDVQYFSEGEIVLCREHYSREEAAALIAKEEIESYGTDENMAEERLREIVLGELKESFVRYCFPPEGAGDGDNEAAWFVGASGRGSKAVWVYE